MIDDSKKKEKISIPPTEIAIDCGLGFFLDDISIFIQHQFPIWVCCSQNILIVYNTSENDARSISQSTECR